MKIFNFTFFVLILLLVSSCTPNKHLLNPSEIEGQVTGHRTRLHTTNHDSYYGELICTDDSSLVILRTISSKQKPVRIALKDIRSLEVIISSTSDKAGPISTWAAVNPIATISHGWFFILSFPVNLISSIAIGNDAASSIYVVKFPVEGSYNELAKFSRFPAGLPPDVDIELLR